MKGTFLSEILLAGPVLVSESSGINSRDGAEEE